MKRTILAFLFFASIAVAQDVLDQPIKGETALEVFFDLQRIHKILPEEDSLAFSNGVSGLTSRVKGWREKEMNETERDEYVFTVVRGMTPRQVIIIGSMLRAIFARKEYLEHGVSSPIIHKDTEHWKAHALLMEDIAATYLARYTIKANQSPDPTAASGRGSP